mmetsp:Transcript_30511/g.59592  ORF Transcript_30511/g.59592 Transcript_30511/m.59592 type:complete len:237 (+) Transcript_30511:352-1062(+)
MDGSSEWKGMFGMAVDAWAMALGIRAARFGMSRTCRCLIGLKGVIAPRYVGCGQQGRQGRQGGQAGPQGPHRPEGTQGPHGLSGSEGKRWPRRNAGCHGSARRYGIAWTAGSSREGRVRWSAGPARSHGCAGRGPHRHSRTPGTCRSSWGCGTCWASRSWWDSHYWSCRSAGTERGCGRSWHARTERSGWYARHGWGAGVWRLWAQLHQEGTAPSLNGFSMLGGEVGRVYCVGVQR